MGKREEAKKLRAKGLSVRKIAKELDVSKSWVHWAVHSTEGIVAAETGVVQGVPAVPEREGLRARREYLGLDSDDPGPESGSS